MFHIILPIILLKYDYILILILIFPTAIRTPLKCPECPMQFCTVRSLLWHFGTHEGRTDDDMPSILLQDLLVPWNSLTTDPFVPVTQQYTNSASPSPSPPMSPRHAGIQDAFSSDAAKLDENIFTSGFLKNASPNNSTIMSKSPSRNDTVSYASPENPSLNSNGDSSIGNKEIILKVPIPRLKNKDQLLTYYGKKKALRKSQKKEKLILPKVSGSDNKSTSSHVFNEKSSVLQSVTSNNFSYSQIPNSQDQLQSNSLQIKPLMQVSSNLPTQITSPTHSATSSSSNQITLLPMDRMSNIGQGINSVNKNASSIRLGTSKNAINNTDCSGNGIMEKDGLVMINPSLGLRIVSSVSNPVTEVAQTTTTDITTIKPIMSQTALSSNGLTIMPQTGSENNANCSRSEGKVKNPDILTIIPQVDLGKKQVSSVKTPSVANLGPQIMTAAGKVNTGTSQIVKLVLLPPKPQNIDESKGKNINVNTNQNNSNSLKTSDTTNNFKEVNNITSNYYSNKMQESSRSLEKDEESDLEDEGMVIDDDKEDLDEEPMDPLSMCAVTMEDENLEGSNSASLPGNDRKTNEIVPPGMQSDINAGLADEEAGNKNSVTLVPMSSSSALEGPDNYLNKVHFKVRGKTHEVDINKYEQRKYVCCFCNRRFGWSTDLKRHIILHTGEKPFQCKFCHVAFTRKFLLQNHMKKLHPDQCRMVDLWPHFGYN